jgi:uncharacterized protein YdbL (DUF1318 family)
MTQFITSLHQLARCAGILLLLLLVSTASAQSRKELEQRLENRYAKLFEEEMRGTIGETWQGYVDTVKSPKGNEHVQKLIDDENADRKALYRIISEEESKKHSISPEAVGERNARRKFDKAKPEQYLRSSDGVWFQRRDVTRLKRDGKIGEVWDGYLAAVREKDEDDRLIAAVLETENRLRKDDYERDAYRRKSDVSAVAERAGQENIDKARAGEYIKRKSDRWEKK